jgi:heterodisulfide reductase subunit C
MSLVKFGFEASDARNINMDHVITSQLQSIFDKEPTLHRCISCGRCAAVCTAGHFTKMQFYKLNLWAHRGQVKQIAEMAKNCMLCGKCQLSCPRGVNIRHGVLLLSELKPEETDK